MRVTPSAVYLEWTKWSDIILEEPYELNDRYVVIPNKTGTGNDFNKNTITSADYEFNRNLRFISHVTFDTGTNKVTLRSDKPHNMKVGNQIIVKNVQSSTNTGGVENKGYNGTFIVTDIDNSKQFKYSNTDVLGSVHTVGTFVNNTLFDPSANQVNSSISFSPNGPLAETRILPDLYKVASIASTSCTTAEPNTLSATVLPLYSWNPNDVDPTPTPFVRTSLWKVIS